MERYGIIGDINGQTTVLKDLLEEYNASRLGFPLNGVILTGNIGTGLSKSSEPFIRKDNCQISPYIEYIQSVKKVESILLEFLKKNPTTKNVFYVPGHRDVWNLSSVFAEKNTKFRNLSYAKEIGSGLHRRFIVEMPYMSYSYSADIKIYGLGSSFEENASPSYFEDKTVKDIENITYRLCASDIFVSHTPFHGILDENKGSVGLRNLFEKEIKDNYKIIIISGFVNNSVGMIWHNDKVCFINAGTLENPYKNILTVDGNFEFHSLDQELLYK